MSGSATKSIIVHTPPEKLYAVVVDYESYPQFLGNMKSAKVVRREGNKVEVAFEMLLLGKSFTYSLVFEENPPKGIKWKLAQSGFMQANSGAWALRSDGENKTHATYSIAIQISMAIPKSMSTALAGAELPKVLEAFKKRAEG